MKKVLMISFLISTILISFLNTSYATVTVTKENLSQAFQSFVSSKANEDNFVFSVEDNVINITEDNETYSLNYDLTGKPTFSAEVDIRKGMSYEDFQNKQDTISLPMYGYIATANIQGVKLEDAAAYFLFSYLGSALGSASTNNGYIIYDDTSASEGVTLERDENSKTILVSEFGDRVMEYVNSLYPQTLTISDSDSEGINSYTMTIEKKEVTETSCKLVSTLTVNTDADFSKLNGTTNKIEGTINNTIISAAQNARNEYAETQKRENQALQNLINSQNSSNIKNQYSSSKLPQTGNFFNPQHTLFILILICMFGIIFLLIPNIKYKNIEQ